MPLYALPHPRHHFPLLNPPFQKQLPKRPFPSYHTLSHTFVVCLCCVTSFSPFSFPQCKPLLYQFPQVFCTLSPLSLPICCFLCFKSPSAPHPLIWLALIHLVSSSLGSLTHCRRLSCVPLLWVAIVPSADVYPVLISPYYKC